MSTLKRKSIELVNDMYISRMKALYKADLRLLDASINIPSLDVGGLKVIRDVHSEHAEVLEYILETLD